MFQLSSKTPTQAAGSGLGLHLTECTRQLVLVAVTSVTLLYRAAAPTRTPAEELLKQCTARAREQVLVVLGCGEQALCRPGTAAAAGEAAAEAAADTVRATLDPAGGGREALHMAARRCAQLAVNV